jgi:hypothetical protein
VCQEPDRRNPLVEARPRSRPEATSYKVFEISVGYLHRLVSSRIRGRLFKRLLARLMKTLVAS